VAEFTTLTLWDSMDAIRRFAGDEPERARYYPEDPEYLLEMTPFVEHYEVAWHDLPQTRSTAGFSHRWLAPLTESQIRVMSRLLMHM
jgi:hypothetical protein